VDESTSPSTRESETAVSERHNFDHSEYQGLMTWTHEAWLSGRYDVGSQRSSSTKDISAFVKGFRRVEPAIRYVFQRSPIELDEVLLDAEYDPNAPRGIVLTDKHLNVYGRRDAFFGGDYYVIRLALSEIVNVSGTRGTLFTKLKIRTRSGKDYEFKRLLTSRILEYLEAVVAHPQGGSASSDVNSPTEKPE
jgi:hypothetical protein